MRPMVSIIVPVYNAEQYLRRCVDSILNQEYTDFEVFLVNDGSTDSSGDICEEYGNKDTRVNVIQKENTGVSDSRNLALDRARGKYLQFLDSDDWITPDATRLFVRAAEEYGCDMVISDFYRVVGERLSPKGDIEEEGVLTQEEFAAHMMENPADFYYGVLWNKLYRWDMVEEDSLRRDTNIIWCEDFLFNLDYITRTNLTSGLQRLTMKGFLKIEEVKEPKPSRKSKAAGEVQGKAEKPETRRKDRKTKVTVTILPTAEAVMKELALAQRDYDEARFVGFTEEELIKYADLSEKIKENTKRILG